MPKQMNQVVVERKLTRRIDKSEESRYVELPFELPERACTLHVSYSVESHDAGANAIIDLGVRDDRRLRGWSGGARSEFRIEPEQATPGYIAGELTPGDWAVVLGAYRVPENGCTVYATVRFELCTPRWLRGDLHTHSVHSDGSFTLEENAAAIKALGCDFIAMTDHNAISQNSTYPRNSGVVMIPGMEFTTNFGHSNFLGIDDPLDDFRVVTQADVDLRIATARARGARIVLNHPHCEYCPWLWDFAADYDWVEIWNGPWTERNARALSWWQEQLAAGRRLVAVGGSDTHRPHPYVKHAYPCTWVLADSRTSAGVLNGIGRGHTFTTFSPDGPFVELLCGDAMMGDTVPVGDAAPELVTVRAEHLLPSDELRAISEHGLERSWIADGDTMDVSVERDGLYFVRVEVWRWFEQVQSKLLAAVTNPIYFDRP
ncbi:CehA/McbA family metallohydrolase [Paenibacillus oryzisoli]|uniref:CehA/McbA family metallohydrolase n=1 Tax=Paenibacillus oryzisoli TaxID=1850517 RepID=UPI003D284883